jgi:hypothetical protein
MHWINAATSDDGVLLFESFVATTSVASGSRAPSLASEPEMV